MDRNDIEKLGPLVERLGAAIDASLKNKAIRITVRKIQKAGYNVFLSLEATLGIEKIEEKETSDACTSPEAPPTKSTLTLTTQDKKFLRTIKVSADPDP